MLCIPYDFRNMKIAMRALLCHEYVGGGFEVPHSHIVVFELALLTAEGHHDGR